MKVASDSSARPRLAELVSAAGGRIVDSPRDEMFSCEVDRTNLTALAIDLRDDPGLRFKLLLDVTAVDWYGEEPRFQVVYHLYSVDLHRRIRVTTRCSERDAWVPSLVSIFPTAEFHERETYDMFGISFEDHPDLRRILLPPEYEHHPLRKDFPLEGSEPEKVYRLRGGVMMPRPEGVEPINGAGSTTP